MSPAVLDRSGPVMSPAFDLVVIAASLGGVHTLQALFTRLPGRVPAPRCVVQHLRAGCRSARDRVRGHGTRWPVRWAQDAAAAQAGTIVLAPPDKPRRVSRAGTCQGVDGPKITFVRPSAGALFA